MDDGRPERFADDDETEETAGEGEESGGGRGRSRRREAHELAAADFAARARLDAAGERVGAQEERDHGDVRLDRTAARELVLAETALAILEDEVTARRSGDELRGYEPAELPDNVAALIGSGLDARDLGADDAATAALAAQLRGWILAWQSQMDFAFDYADAGDPVPTRTVMLRGAIAAAIARVGGLGGTPTVGAYVLALRRSRSIAAEPLVDVWLEHSAYEDLMPPPDGSGRRRAAEAIVVLEATGALEGRSEMHDVLAVENALATLNDVRAQNGLAAVRLADLRRDRGVERDTGVELDREFRRPAES